MQIVFKTTHAAMPNVEKTKPETDIDLKKIEKKPKPTSKKNSRHRPSFSGRSFQRRGAAVDMARLEN